MHILVTNDDGPPSAQSSPYVHSLITHLQAAGHVVSVCLPHTQRSWIGKAHMIGQTLKPVYYRPSNNPHDADEGSTHTRPHAGDEQEEWVLIDGTPASCVQIGLHHFFQERGPIDLVVSGPNYGRNTTAVFALSSGTLGAALEAAVCCRKSIALSFAFFTRNHDPQIIDEACRHSVKVIHALYKQWPEDRSVDLYSVNVPLVEGVEGHKTVFTEVLQNYWRDGSCFQEAEAEDEDEQEEEIRKGEVQGNKREENGKGHKHKHFKWAPRFSDVYKSVEESGPGNDGWVVKEGQTSITPLKANFASALGDKSRELVLSKVQEPSIEAIVAYDDPYVQPLIVSAVKKTFPRDTVRISEVLPSSFDSATKTVAITAYEAIDFEHAAANPREFLINSYMIRKALIRKHFLSTTIDHWTAKNPDSILKRSFKRSEHFEVDYAEFLDDALIEAFDLRESMESNEEKDIKDREWWILKPGMSDRGQGIKLFSSMDELQGIFDKWEEDRPDSDDEEDEGEEQQGKGDYITTSHLRHFVAQPYIHPPLLLPDDDRKFHIRTYVCCVGALQVYVYQDMLALFAAKSYKAPYEESDDIETFLTNTCLQSSPNENTVQLLSSLPLEKSTLESITKQIGEITGELFEAAARAMPIHFQPMPNAFEVFGLDFLVDRNGSVWGLEVNAFPDFRQTGGQLKGVVEGFWEGVVNKAVKPFFGMDQGPADKLALVKDVDLGRR